MSDGGVYVNVPEFGMLARTGVVSRLVGISRGTGAVPLIRVPSTRSLLAPSLSRNVTVPLVVGSHVMVVGLPAVNTGKPPFGILMGFS